MEQLIVSIERLNHYYGDGELRRQVLFDINIKIHPGEFVIMTGPSGSGKSTLLSLIGCLRSVQKGSLKVLGQELNGAGEAARTRVRRHFGYIFQASNLLTFLTVRKNICMSMELHSDFDRRRIYERTQSILDSVGLLPQIDRYPNQLSGGQKQRVAIACALVTQPKLVLADEPTAALDSHTGRKTIELMHRLAKERGSAVLMVTHDQRILDVADRIVRVEDGRLGLAYSQELSLALPGLKEEQITAMAVKPDLITYEPGAAIFREGDRARRFFVVLKGRVEAFHDRPGQPLKVLNTLRRGDYFGEIGLLQEDGRRTASIRVTADAEAKLMVVGREDFRKLMAGSDLTAVAIAQKLQQRLNTTALAEALPALDVQEIARILPQVEKFKYGPGSHIVNEGDPAEYFYIIVSGRAEAIGKDERGREVSLSALGPGDYFGEIGLISGRPRTATVRAHPETAVEAIALDRDAFKQLLETSQFAQTEIARVVYERMKKSASNDLDAIAYKPGAYVFHEGDLANKCYVVVRGRVEAVRDRPGQPIEVLNTWERGACFGELELLQEDGHRTVSARVTADAEAKLAVVDRGDFQRLMAGSGSTAIEIAQKLQQQADAIAPIEALPTDRIREIVRILPQFEKLKYEPGSLVFDAGDPPEYFYIIVAGIVETTGKYDRGREILLETLGPGDCFGEVGLVEGTPRTSEARARGTTTVEALALRRDAFVGLMATSDLTQVEIARVVYERLKTASGFQEKSVSQKERERP